MKGAAGIYSCMRCTAYFIQKDLFRSVKENGQTLLFTFLFAFAGVALGIYVGVKIDPAPAENGIFACLFRLEYTPFAWSWRFFIRFFLYFLLGYLGYFLLHPWLFGGIGVFLFSKYICEIATLCLRCDSLFSALCSLLIVYLPLFLLGVFLFFYLILDMLGQRSCKASFTRRRIMQTVGRFFGLLAIYFSICLLLFVAVCGILYLIAVAV